MSTALVINPDQQYWTEQQLSALKSLGLAQASSGDLAFFFHQAQRTGLDPFARQIYMIERGNKYTIQTSIDGFRIIAQRSGEYAGQTAPFWCGDDGEWKDVWLSKDAPRAAKIGVYRAGFAEPLWAVATLDAYMPLTRDGKPMGLWSKMPSVMLAKCAESLALRKAFPNDLSGLYTDEEMTQAEVREEVYSKPKPVAVDTTVVEAEVVDTTGVDWQKIIDEAINAKDKDTIKQLWNTNKALLDVKIPDMDNFTVRDLYLDSVKQLEVNV